MMAFFSKIIIYCYHAFYLFGNLHYSYRKASIGLRLPSLLAGYHPKKIPITEHTRNDITTERVVITTGQLIIEANIGIATIPSVIPVLLLF
ncbi:MAG: hypothetical protein WCL21_16785 [Mariniphaga sp.]